MLLILDIITALYNLVWNVRNVQFTIHILLRCPHILTIGGFFFYSFISTSSAEPQFFSAKSTFDSRHYWCCPGPTLIFICLTVLGIEPVGLLPIPGGFSAASAYETKQKPYFETRPKQADVVTAEGDIWALKTRNRVVRLILMKIRGESFQSLHVPNPHPSVKCPVKQQNVSKRPYWSGFYLCHSLYEWTRSSNLSLLHTLDISQHYSSLVSGVNPSSVAVATLLLVPSAR